DDFARAKLEEIRGLLNRAPGLVHEGRRPEQHDLLVLKRAFRSCALKATAPGSETLTACDFVHGHEADIMPVIGVFRAGIAEANKESHDAVFPARAANQKFSSLSPRVRKETF